MQATCTVSCQFLYISITLIQINKKDADDFNQSWILNPPNIPVKVSVNPRMSDFKNNLNYPITIEGIKVTESQTSPDNKPQIVISRSLASNLQSECLSNTCICSILIITLF